MIARRFGPLVLLVAAACTKQSPYPGDECHSWACSYPDEATFSFLTLRRSWGPDTDTATWRFSVDETTCTLTSPASSGAPATASCAVEGQPDDRSVPLFVSAASTPAGFGRLFRIDTMGRAVAHVRIERNGVLIDAFDHRPTFSTSEECAVFAYDLGGERELPPAP